MMRVAILNCLLLSLSALADDKKSALYEKKSDRERVYAVSYDALWDAAIASAKEHYIVKDDRKETGAFTFETGAGFTNQGFLAAVTVEKVGESKTRIKISLQKKTYHYSFGAGGRITEKFFKTLDEKLK
jgi:hypothetical protein